MILSLFSFLLVLFSATTTRNSLPAVLTNQETNMSSYSNTNDFNTPSDTYSTGAGQGLTGDSRLEGQGDRYSGVGSDTLSTQQFGDNTTSGGQFDNNAYGSGGQFDNNNSSNAFGNATTGATGQYGSSQFNDTTGSGNNDALSGQYGSSGATDSQYTEGGRGTQGTGNKPTMGDKISGTVNELVGKVTKNPTKVEEGQIRKTEGKQALQGGLGGTSGSY